jgi:hypothetical protein
MLHVILGCDVGKIENLSSDFRDVNPVENDCKAYFS